MVSALKPLAISDLEDDDLMIDDDVSA